MKRWLLRNKIYFETISATSLASMAIVVSVASITISKNQLDNQELLNKPLIKVSNEVFAYSGTQNDSRFLNIENEGTPITGFSSEIYTFVKIKANTEPYIKSNDRQTILIPIKDYFGGTTTSNNFTGKIRSYIGINNYNLLRNIENDFSDNYGKDFPMTFFSLIQYIEIHFQDYKGGEVNKVFEISEIRGGREIKKNEEYNTLIKTWNSTISKSYIYKLTSEDIKRIIINNGS